MKRGTKPTIECLSNEDHDEDLLHTITITCMTQGGNNIRFFSIKKDKLVINTTEDWTQMSTHGSDDDQHVYGINSSYNQWTPMFNNPKSKLQTNKP